MKRNLPIIPIIFDGIIFLLIALWFVGGIEYHNAIYFKHGTDLRRSVVILLVIGYFFHSIQQNSLWLRAFRNLRSSFQNSNTQKIALAAFLLLLLLNAFLQTYAFRVYLYDSGIFHQSIWSFLHGHGFYTSISGSGDHLKDHLSLSFALFAPFFWITGSAPWSLPVIHALLIAMTAGAWMITANMLEKRFHQKDLVFYAFVFALTFHSIYANLWWGFHETSIYFCAMSWVLFYWVKAVIVHEKLTAGEILGFSTLLLISALSKESSLLDCAFFAIFAAFTMFSSKRRYFFLVLAALFLATFVWYSQLPKPADKNYFVRYYSYLGSDLKSVAANLITHPFSVFENIGFLAIVTFLFQILLPWLFLPVIGFFLGNRREKFLAFGLLFCSAPTLGMILLSTNQDLRELKYHYVLIFWPPFYILTLLVFSKFSKVKNQKILIAWIALNGLLLSKDLVMNFQQSIADIQNSWGASDLVAKIPPDATLAASEEAGTWVANRMQVTRWPKLPENHCPEFILLRKDDPVQTHECLNGMKLVEQSKRWNLYSSTTLIQNGAVSP